MPSDQIRVVLADDHAVVRAGLKVVLSTAKDIVVVGEASNGREAVAAVERLTPDVLVTDIAMPEMDGTATTKAVVAKGLPTKVLVLTMHTEEEYLIPLLEAGAAGYLVKNTAERDLIAAVRAVAHGDAYVAQSASNVLVRGILKKDPMQAERARYDALTPREKDVLRLVAQGYTAPEIGERMFISPKTVDTYKQRIQEKLGLAHRSEYVQYALKLGLLVQD